MQNGWRERGERHGLSLAIEGIPPMSTFTFQHGEDARRMATLYTQEMLDAGFLASGAFYAMAAHRLEDVDAALDATDRAFGRIRKELEAGTLDKALRGPVAHEGFKRLT